MWCWSEVVNDAMMQCCMKQPMYNNKWCKVLWGERMEWWRAPTLFPLLILYFSFSQIFPSQWLGLGLPSKTKILLSSLLSKVLPQVSCTMLMQCRYNKWCINDASCRRYCTMEGKMEIKEGKVPVPLTKKWDFFLFLLLCETRPLFCKRKWPFLLKRWPFF